MLLLAFPKGIPAGEFIHNNPKEAGLVDELLNWKYSSAREYAGLNQTPLCNIDWGRKIIGLE
ncbi:MAG: hypothetical protein ABIR66_04885 [Saprospiraceae bacterium]